MNLITAHDATPADGSKSIAIANDADPRTLTLTGVERIDLHFPQFTDGRAFTQAFLLRRRLGFVGEIRATGEVLLDQLVQMQRTGFDAAVLRADQDLNDARAQFERYRGFYQGDAVQTQPRFGAAAVASGSKA
jgi:uncharacterized protein (DUF934 family)